MGRAGIFALGILLVAGAACNESAPEQGQSGPGQSKTLSVNGVIINPEPLMTDLRVPGSILPAESTEIHPEVSGRIIQLNIGEGGYASSGELLAKLYDGDLQAQLRKLEVQLKIAEQTETRQAKLLDIQGISQQDYDLSLLQVRTLQADKEIIAEEIRKTEIRAPFSGTLGLKHVSPGAYVTPATILTTISQLNNLKLEFSVPERYGALMVKGMEVVFTVDGSNEEFIATVLATEASIDEQTRSLTVRARISDNNPALIPGAFANVHVVLGEESNVLLVPNILIFSNGRRKQIYTFRGGKVEQTDVQTGVRDSSRVEIVSGLRPGDTLITSSLLFLRPGMDVEFGRIESDLTQ